METCYKCHAPLTPGKVFCPECRAPLIRVNLPEPPTGPIPVTGPVEAHVTADFQPRVADHNALQWRQALRAVIPAGIIGSIFMMFPLGIGVIGMIAAGTLSAVFYYHRASAKNLSTVTGAKLGALTGMFGGMFTIIYTSMVLVFWGGGQFHAAMMEQLNRYAAQIHDPRQLELIEYFKTPSGLAVVVVLGTLIMLFLFFAFSTLGGVLGATWIRKRHRS